jgi:hypothetical protein
LNESEKLTELNMALEILLLSKAKATEYLGCLPEELERWVMPDRKAQSNPAVTGMRLWSGPTLDDAMPHIEEWRERDQAANHSRGREVTARVAAIAAQRKGMHKAGAMLAGRVRKILGCTRTELDRWAGDQRFAPDGLIHVYGMGVRKSVNARAWLRAAIEAAKQQVSAWREQDKLAKMERRRHRKPPLRRIHSDALYEQNSSARRNLEYHRARTTEEIIDSLRPGAKESLKVKPDGRVFQGNTRIKVLEERGYPVDDLPREPVA